MVKVFELIGALKDGGAETLVKDYAALIDKEKFDVAILTIYPMKDTANYRQVSEMGTRILSVYPRYNVLVRMFNKAFERWYVPFRLKQIIKRERPDCIHMNSPVAWLVAPIRKALKGTKLVYTCHSEPEKYFICNHRNEAPAVHKLVRENRMQLIALHEEMRQDLNRRFSVEDTVIVNNGVNFRRYRYPAWDAAQIRASAGIPQDAFLTVHVGRFASVKNHWFLLDVFSKIKAKKANAHLLLVGDGPLKGDICRQINEKGLADCVTMLSHRTDVPELLYAADLVVFPSQYEGLSVTLVEAQVTGLRCLVSDSVNGANFLTENTIPLSLERSAEEWADVALDESVKNARYGDLQQFDLGREIRKLEAVYAQ